MLKTIARLAAMVVVWAAWNVALAALIYAATLLLHIAPPYSVIIAVFVGTWLGARLRYAS